ncbi:MAG: hypothetical protein KY462_02710 [Actinobacteria bacterium]|nr:hypothetical protein [Actinomycetota bacterium]
MGGLSGSLSPAVLAEPGGDRIVYRAWDDARVLDPGRSLAEQGIHRDDPLGTPVLRLFDPSTGSDRVLVEGVDSAAWRADGALAYAQGVDPVFRAGRAWNAVVTVRPDLDGDAVVWSSQPGSVVLAGPGRASCSTPWRTECRS